VTAGAWARTERGALSAAAATMPMRRFMFSEVGGQGSENREG
jgi:hypothetical protein